MKSDWLVCGSGFLGKEIKAKTNSLNIPQQIHETLKYSHQVSSDSLATAAKWLAITKPSYFVNASGPANVSESIVYQNYYQEEPMKLAKAHIQLLSRLKTPPKYIYLSSAAVYGETSVSGASELVSPKPISPYGTGKLRAEDYLRGVEGMKIQIVIARIFSTYSMALESRLPFAIHQKFESNSHAEFEGTGQETRDFIHTSDVVSALSFIASKETCIQTSIWNLSSGTPMTISEIVKLAANEFERVRIGTKYYYRFNNSKRPYDPVTLVGDITKLTKLGFKVQINPRVGLPDYFRQRA
jgi:UDP-glucose 4-epimerase